MKHDDARHLASRAGLDTHPRTVEALGRLDRDEAVELLLKESPGAVVEPPAWAIAGPWSRKKLLAELGGDKKKLKELRQTRARELKQWWLREMVATPAPLTERMTLFWHNHFTSSLRKVKLPALLYRQNVLLRAEAFGNYRRFVRAIARDPAMLVYLDNFRNFADNPNENFARELLELFTLGEGHYTERDVKEAARALTGWSVNRRTGEFREVPRRHDSGEKRFLGRSGRFDGDDVIDVIFEHPRCAEHLLEKVWREFVSLPLRASRRDELARDFRADWEIRPLLRAILTSDEFWSAKNRGTLIKSPVELVVGTVRTLGISIEDASVMAKACRALGQDIFDPPNVKGWEGGPAWIASNTLLRRVQLLARAAKAPNQLQSPEKWLGGAWKGDADEERVRKALLPISPVQAVAQARTPARLVARLVIDPAYQLK